MSLAFLFDYSKMFEIKKKFSWVDYFDHINFFILASFLASAIVINDLFLIESEPNLLFTCKTNKLKQYFFNHF